MNKKVLIVLLIILSLIVTVISVFLWNVGYQYLRDRDISNREQAIFEDGKVFIFNDEYFNSEYGTPVSITRDTDKEFNWIKNKECIIPCIIETDSKDVYYVLLGLNYESGVDVFYYESIENITDITH